jgi:hypothetical protein
VDFDDPWAGYPLGNPFQAQYSADAPFVTFGGHTVMPYDIDPTQTQNWSLSVQRQLGEDWLVSANYIGSHTVHMLMTAPLNVATYFPGNADANGNCFADGYTFRTNPGAVCSTTGNTDNRRRLSLIDFQQTGQYVGPLAEYQSVGNANYHGLLLNLRKRAARGVTLNTNYTWSHCISSEQDTLNGSLYAPQNTYTYADDRERGRSNCTQDRRHNLNLTGVFATPEFANNTLRYLASGWRLSTIYRYTTGSMMTITAGNGLDLARNGTNANAQTANQIDPNPYSDRSGEPRSQWFNTAAFQRPAVGTFGNLGMRNLVGPANWQFDAALTRTFRIAETQDLEFRAEAYNVTNSFRPTNPNTQHSNAQFGILNGSRDTRILQFAVKYAF